MRRALPIVALAFGLASACDADPKAAAGALGGVGSKKTKRIVTPTDVDAKNAKRIVTPTDVDAKRIVTPTDVDAKNKHIVTPTDLGAKAIPTPIP